MKAPSPATPAAAGPKRAAISTATVPLSASSSTVAAARSLRPARSTFVAPILPEPIERRSVVLEFREHEAERN